MKLSRFVLEAFLAVPCPIPLFKAILPITANGAAVAAAAVALRVDIADRCVCGYG